MKLVAHRGGGCPENTIESIIDILGLNIYDGIEIDVQITKDNVLVLFHDDDTERITGQRFIIKEMTYNELLKLDAGYTWPKYRNKGYKIPRLKDVLALTKKRNIILHLDLKDENCVMPAIKLLLVYKNQFKEIYLDSSKHSVNEKIIQSLAVENIKGVYTCASTLETIKTYALYLLNVEYKTRDVVYLYLNWVTLPLLTLSLITFFKNQDICVGVYGPKVSESNKDYFGSMGIDLCICDHC